MSREKSETELRRDGVFVTLESVAETGVKQIVAAYNMGRNDAEETGRVLDLKRRVIAYEQQVKGLHLRIGRDAVKHDTKMKRIGEGLDQVHATLVHWQNAVRANGYAVCGHHCQAFTFVEALRKELAK